MKEELDLAGDNSKVFKLIGLALVNQVLAEAKDNMEKRIAYIRREQKRPGRRYRRPKCRCRSSRQRQIKAQLIQSEV